MTAASANAQKIIKEALDTHPSSRWLVYDRLARDYGDGFAKRVQAQVEESERERANRKGGR